MPQLQNWIFFVKLFSQNAKVNKYQKERMIVVLMQMTHTLFPTHYSLVFDSCPTSRLLLLILQCLHTHSFSPYVFISGSVTGEKNRILPAGGNSSSLVSLSHTRSVPHPFIMILCLSQALFPALSLFLFLSFNSQNMIYTLALFIPAIFSIHLSRYLLAFLCPFFPSSFSSILFIVLHFFAVLLRINYFQSKVF